MNRFLKILILNIILLTIIISGCANDPPPAPLNEYFPINEGSSWSYAGEGNEYAAFERKILFVEENRAQFTEDNGGTVSSSVIEISEEEITRTFFQGEEYEPLNLLGAYPNDDLIILKAPIEVGESWETGNGVREIMETNASIETPAGKFDNCLKISITTENTTMYEYYKAGVGLIKREFIVGEASVISILEKYNIG